MALYSIDVCAAAAGAACAEDGSGESSATWRSIVNPKASSFGGQTIGTHHIDIVAANATSVRLRLLDVLKAPVSPLISFRVLRVG